MAPDLGLAHFASLNDGKVWRFAVDRIGEITSHRRSGSTPQIYKWQPGVAGSDPVPSKITSSVTASEFSSPQGWQEVLQARIAMEYAHESSSKVTVQTESFFRERFDAVGRLTTESDSITRKVT